MDLSCWSYNFSRNWKSVKHRRWMQIIIAERMMQYTVQTSQWLWWWAFYQLYKRTRSLVFESWWNFHCNATWWVCNWNQLIEQIARSRSWGQSLREHQNLGQLNFEGCPIITNRGYKNQVSGSNFNSFMFYCLYGCVWLTSFLTVFDPTVVDISVM